MRPSFAKKIGITCLAFLASVSARAGEPVAPPIPSAPRDCVAAYEQFIEDAHAQTRKNTGKQVLLYTAAGTGSLAIGLGAGAACYGLLDATRVEPSQTLAAMGAMSCGLTSTLAVLLVSDTYLILPNQSENIRHLRGNVREIEKEVLPLLRRVRDGKLEGSPQLDEIADRARSVLRAHYPGFDQTQPVSDAEIMTALTREYRSGELCDPSHDLFSWAVIGNLVAFQVDRDRRDIADAAEKVRAEEEAARLAEIQSAQDFIDWVNRPGVGPAAHCDGP